MHTSDTLASNSSNDEQELDGDEEVQHDNSKSKAKQDDKERKGRTQDALDPQPTPSGNSSVATTYVKMCFFSRVKSCQVCKLQHFYG